MIELRPLTSTRSTRVFSCGKLPCSIGRSNKADIEVQEPGVWENHATLQCEPDHSITIEINASAIAHLNGERITKAVIHNGDIIELGGAKLLFGLSSAPQHALASREVFTWGILGFVLSLEAFLLLTTRNW